MIRHLIIGNGVAGLAAAISIREHDEDGEITLIGDEPHPPYFRAGLSEWMHGAIEDDELHVRPAAMLDRLGIRSVTARASQLDVEAHTVSLEDGSTLEWDKLLVATGARPFVPPWPGADLRGVFTYRTWEDCAAIKAAVTARPDKPAVIVGAGILGLELAWDCKGLGVPAVMLVRDPQVGRPIFDDAAADKLLERLRDDDVTVHLEEEVDHFEGRDGDLIAVVTNQGRRIECSAVVAAIGVAPETAIFDGTGIAVDRWVKVDGHMRTSHADVYAAGDVATVFDPMIQAHAPTRTWEPSYWGGRTAGENMAGGSKQYVPCTMMNASLVYDLKYVLMGGFLSFGDDVETVTDPAPRGRYGYRKLLLKDDVLVGGTFLDDRRHYMAYRQLMQTRVKVTDFKDRLLDADFDPNLALPKGTLDYYFY
jgi:nitrite reductase (NADH) large subunit